MLRAGNLALQRKLRQIYLKPPAAVQAPGVSEFAGNVMSQVYCVTFSKWHLALAVTSPNRS